MVNVFVSGDAEVSRDPEDGGFDAVGEESPHSFVHPRRQLLPWAQLKMCHW
jgi:hypothetical protein